MLTVRGSTPKQIYICPENNFTALCVYYVAHVI